jgi:hypothetical protein
MWATLTVTCEIFWPGILDQARLAVSTTALRDDGVEDQTTGLRGIVTPGKRPPKCDARGVPVVAAAVVPEQGPEVAIFARLGVVVRLRTGRWRPLCLIPKTSSPRLVKNSHCSCLLVCSDRSCSELSAFRRVALCCYIARGQ